MDEALFLMRADDDDSVNAISSQQAADQALLDQYLEGVLPGEASEMASAHLAGSLPCLKRKNTGTLLSR